MNKSTFYGTRKKNKDISLQVRLARREKYEKEQSAPSIYKPRILGPCRTWKIFYTQKEAFDAAKTGQKDLHVFSFESECFQDNSGQRMFLVTSYEEFWHYYNLLKSPQRHHYEIITEGSVCRLYFDLEFMKEYNTGRDGAKMTSIFITYVQGMLFKYWKINCCLYDVLQLEASTEAKFSRHLIFHIKNTAFKDNVVMGNFVKHIINVLLYTVNGTETAGNNQFDKPKHSYNNLSGKEERTNQPFSDITNQANNTEFVQLKHKTESQNLDKSCTETKTENLVSELHTEKNLSFNTSDESELDVSKISENQTNITIDLDNLDVDTTQEDIFNMTNEHDAAVSPLNQSVYEPLVEETNEYSGEFLESIGLTKDDLKQIMVKNKDGKDALFCDIGVYTKNRNFRLYLSSKMKKNNPLVIAEDNKYHPKLPSNRKKTKYLERIIDKEEQLFLDSLVTNVIYKEDIKILTFETQSQFVGLLPGSSSRIQDPADIKEGGELSPYPEVDQFVSTIISKGGVNGRIRRWLYFTQSETIIYDIVGNRWCGRINRPHKSNNIMIVVVLPRGIYYQKCHDPECKLLMYKSPDYNLPSDIIQLYCKQSRSRDDYSDDFSNDTVTDDLLLSALDTFSGEEPDKGPESSHYELNGQENNDSIQDEAKLSLSNLSSGKHTFSEDNHNYAVADVTVEADTAHESSESICQKCCVGNNTDVKILDAEGLSLNSEASISTETEIASSREDLVGKACIVCKTENGKGSFKLFQNILHENSPSTSQGHVDQSEASSFNSSFPKIQKMCNKSGSYNSDQHVTDSSSLSSVDLNDDFDTMSDEQLLDIVSVFEGAIDSD